VTEDEHRTHLSWWSILAAPRLAGNDLRNMTPAILGILAHREVIAIDQDAAGSQGRLTTKSGDQEVWGKALSTAVGPRQSLLALLRRQRSPLMGRSLA